MGQSYSAHALGGPLRKPGNYQQGQQDQRKHGKEDVERLPRLAGPGEEGQDEGPQERPNPAKADGERQVAMIVLPPVEMLDQRIAGGLQNRHTGAHRENHRHH